VTGHAVVIGGNPAGVRAALDIADAGIKVTILEKSPSLPEDKETSLFLRPILLRAASHPNIRVLTSADVTAIENEEGLYRLKISQSPRYVDPNVCTSCGKCVENCPVTLTDTDSGETSKAIHFPSSGLKSTPSTCLISKHGIAPCTAACPAGINAHGYLALISKGKFREALAMVRSGYPFPHILGRVCTHPCESACTRGKIDQPVAIASLKRFLADAEAAETGLGYYEEVTFEGPKRVAIVGAGPAGLTCARDLAKLGYRSTIFEALPVPGGMIAVGMPRFRLPREIRESEINSIAKMGVEIKTNTTIGKDLTLDDLKSRGYEVFFVAIGAHKNTELGIEGESLDGVVNAIEMLRKINLKQPVKLGDNVAIIGGGYTAIDCARSAIRLGCKSVTILYRRTPNEMMATAAEILETTEEGVKMEYLVAPLRIIGKDGRVTGIECQRMELSKLDESGRASPVPLEGSEFIMEVDTVIPAIGQLPDLDMLNSNLLGIGNDGKTLSADPLTLETNIPGVFAGGDAVYGPRSMVEAVGDGRRAAVSIDRFLRGKDLRTGRTIQTPLPVEVDIESIRIPPGKRRRIPVLPIKKRIKSFEEVETGYTTFMALREAKRCLNCAGCAECLECTRICELQAIHHRQKPSKSDLEASAVIVAEKPGISMPDTVYSISGGNISQHLINASAAAINVIEELAEYRQLRESVSRDNPVTVASSSPKIGVFVCRCGGTIASIMDIPDLLVRFSKHEDVVFAHAIDYSCNDKGAEEIRQLAQLHGLTHAVVAACACCGLDQICFSCADRRIQCKGKLLGHSRTDGILYEFVNIREHCAWVHHREPEKAMEKAYRFISGAIARLKNSAPGEQPIIPIKQSVIVIGGSTNNVQTAASLGKMGVQTYLVTQKGFLPDESTLEQIQQSGIIHMTNTRLNAVEGSIGDYCITVERDRNAQSLSGGAIVFDPGATNQSDLPRLLEIAGDRTAKNPLDLTDSGIPGIFLSGVEESIKEKTSLRTLGEAVAARVTALLGQGEIRPVQTFAVADPRICRGCGTCAAICEFGAASLVEETPGVFVSRIDPNLCRGCGTCVAHCPSGALSQQGMDDCQILASVEAILAT